LPAGQPPHGHINQAELIKSTSKDKGGFHEVEFTNHGISTDHGWRITLDRGLDLFQWFEFSPFNAAVVMREARLVKGCEFSYIRTDNRRSICWQARVPTPGALTFFMTTMLGATFSIHLGCSPHGIHNTPIACTP
jgi:hypothetical protein